MAKTMQARIDILVDAAKAQAALKRVTRETDKFNRSTQRTKGNPFKSVTRSVAGLAGAYIGAQGLITVVQGAVREQQQSIKVGRQTNAVLKSTKSAAGLSAKAISDLAQALSEKTAIDDEAIQSAENLLLTFTKIGKDTFPTATQAVLDLSVATGTSLKGASIQVGKALQDPVKGITALRRVGVNFSTDQQAVIKKLVETGKTAEAQKLILKELAVEFGGSAAAQATPLDKLKVTYQNLLETLGTYLVPVLNKVATATIKFVEQFRAGTGAGGDFKNALKGIYDTLRPIVALLVNHPRLVAGAAAAYIAFKATLGTMNLYNTLITGFGGTGKWSAAGAARGTAMRLGLAASLIMLVPTISRELSKLSPTLARYSGEAQGSAGKAWKNLGTDLADVLTGGIFARLVGIKPLIRNEMKDTAAAAGSAKGWFNEAGGKLADALKNGIFHQTPVVTAEMRRLLRKARTAANREAFPYKNTGELIGKTISNGFFTSTPIVTSEAKRLIRKARKAANDQTPGFRQVGIDMGEGVRSGLASKVSGLISTAVDAVKEALRAARRATEAKSPSKVWARLGKDLGDGLVVGMMATLPAVKGAAKAVATAASFGVGDELKVGAAERNAGMAKTKRGKRKTQAALRAAQRTQTFNEAKGTLQTFINSLVDKIKSAKLAQIMAPVDRARNARAAREYASSKVSLSTQISRAQADANNPKAQERYQREAARLDARIQAARAAGNLEAEDALQSEKDALDARYGPEYLKGLQDQLAQLNENEIERTSEAAATAFAETFRKGFDSALTQLLNGGTVENFFKRIGQTLGGSGVAPGDTKDISGGAGAAGGTIAPSGWASRFSRYFRGKTKGSFAASAIGAVIGASQSDVYKHRKSAPAGYKIQNRASGGFLTPGALTLVGETGPELIVGGKVNSATRTSRMGAGAAGMNITINAHGAAANDPVLLARELGWQLATR